MSRIVPLSLVRNPKKTQRASTLAELRSGVDEAMQEGALRLIESEGVEPESDVRFPDVERKERAQVFAIGLALLMLFLALRDRGFGDDTGKLVQIVTDGDPDLMRLRREFFPNAEHTIDYFHVSEYLWIVGACLFVEGSDEQGGWVGEQKQRLFDDDPEAIVAELRERRDAIPKRGPGNKGRRERLATTLRYLERRLDHIRYGSLRRRDLEIGSDAVEGAVKHVIAKRCGHGGMRWIKERAEAVLQLRCIEVNGHWDLFEGFVHDRLIAEGLFNRAPPRMLQNQPEPLPMAA